MTGVADEVHRRAEVTISVAAGAAAIAAEDWRRLAPAGNPFLDGRFVAILERHGTAGPQCGWRPRHLVARDGSGCVVGILPMYLRDNSYGDFTGDWSWSAAFGQAGIAYYPKLLTGVPHTPATGPRLLVQAGAGAGEVRRRLIEAAKGLAGEHGLSSWHVAFPDADDRAALVEGGLAVADHVQFHWRDGGHGDFAGYLACFSAENRRKVRAQRRRAAGSGLVFEVRHGDEIDADEWPQLYRIYASTFEKFGNWAVFTADGFAELAAALGRRMVLFIARAATRAVALAICFRSDDTLYGRYWGSLEEHHSLHFELCFYQGIDYCLREGLARFEPGADGEHKVARGFVPTIVHSAHWVVDPAMRAAVVRHLDRQRQALADYRDEAGLHLPFRCAEPS